MEYVAGIYALIGLVVAVYIYRKSPPGFHSAFSGVVVGAIWPAMLLVLLTSEDRDI